MRIDLSAPPPNTTAEVLALLEPLDLNGKRVAVQLYGEPNPALSQALTSRGATVLELHVAEEDLGKVIGRQGRVARALRTIVRASGARSNERALLEIVG